MRRSDIEIMALVGSYEALNAAIAAGANSVYFGVEQLNMRAASSVNFTLDDLAEIVRTAHAAGVKTYLTVNIIIYDTEMEVMRRIIDRAKAEGIDAIIATDLAAILYAREVGIEVHISTQSNISNIEAAKFFAQWADVVVLARELSLEQIGYISEQIREQDIRGPRGELLKIEMFAHGAMCMSMSGKCYLSEHESHNSANRGACRQICRRKYTITDKDTGQQLDIDGQYVLSPKDLCTIDFLDKFIEAGVTVLKIEGRARGGEYVKRVVECYNEALNLLERGEFTADSVAPLKERLRTVFNRDFWGGYYVAKTMVEHSQHYGSSATLKKVYMGKVTNYFKRIGVAEVLVEACEVKEGDDLLFMGEKTGVVEQKALGIMLNEKPTDSAKQGDYISLKTEQEVRRGDKVYKEVAR
ncbi:MAG: U32 family peptidase [Alistipes sp.]|nr:U32 family peptidase [Alistipes sp.]